MATTIIANKETGPHINVTPLIDVLLVLLIIFMVAVPLRPSRFLTKIPAEPDKRELLPDTRTLVVTIERDHTLKLNALNDMGTVEDTGKLSATLVRLFDERKKNHTYRDEMVSRLDLPEEKRVEKTVFIKADPSLAYSDVVRVIDGLKGSGANPIGLQLDGLR